MTFEFEKFILCLTLVQKSTSNMEFSSKALGVFYILLVFLYNFAFSFNHTTLPFLLRPTEVVVQDKITETYFVIPIKSPCHEFPPDDQFQLACKKAFSKVTDILQPFSIAKRAKRNPYYVAGAALGVGVIGVLWLIKQEVEISKLKARIGRLENSLQAIINNLDQFKDDLVKLVKVFNSTNQQGELEALALVEKRLANSVEGFTDGKVNAQFLSFLTSIPDVAKTTRVKYWQPMGLIYDPSNEKLTCRVGIPSLDSNFVVATVDPFLLYDFSADGQYWCTYKYTFDDWVVVDKHAATTTCIRRFKQHFRPGPLLITESEFNANCSEIDPFSFFAQDTCISTANVNFTESVQRKIVGNQLNLYCYGNTAAIGFNIKKCEQRIYRLPLTASYVVNDEKFSSSKQIALQADPAEASRQEELARQFVNISNDFTKIDKYISIAQEQLNKSKSIGAWFGDLPGNLLKYKCSNFLFFCFKVPS